MKRKTLSNPHPNPLPKGEGKTHFKSPIGILEITASKKGIISITMKKSVGARFPRQGWETQPLQKGEYIDSPLLKKCCEQLDDYFSGKRKTFDVPLDLHGTDFQKCVWRELQKIPFGKTVSYGNIAKKIKNPQAFRAVGNANNKNPIGIIVPCHRVIGANGKLVGYAGGLNKKKWLLKHEGVC